MTSFPAALKQETAQTITFNDVASREFWQRHFPGMTIEGKMNASATKPQQTLQRISERMARDGYFGETDALLAKRAPQIAQAVETCVKLGLPPVFAFVFDEPWECYHRLKPVLTHLLGEDYKLLPDFWAWHVDPKKQQSGWRPHRDKGMYSLSADGAPLSLTLWVPLNDATPMTSCIYVVPAHLDPTYCTEREKQHTPPLHAIRALPAKPGEWLCWNQALLHWGSPASEFADTPRISMALEFQRGDIAEFNAPLLPPEPYPPFGFRLQLIGKQIQQYTHMYGFSENLQQLAAYLIQNGRA